ncbi:MULTISPECIES: HipA family kinase [Mycetohabitans]|uniref:HipA family kinase n=1 Tax=Mycetohabitans TaxID=2571159 RepID=UPI001F2574AC|nr:HipA family kinase [Mycetohabitans sp. B3]MCF2133222.1 hypothetical protein [Mycetohabitans sp. B3]
MFNREVVQIVEVLGRATQGITQPFICRGDDKQLYFVKGLHAGRRSLVAEWLGSAMAEAFGLPVAPFRIAQVADELIKIGPSHFAELGAGYAFASCAVPNALEMSWTLLGHVDPELQLDVIVFDWWIRNQDRTLTEKGGNPNLLWDPGASRMLVIDQNQAFDPYFDRSAFLELHPFSQVWHRVYEDFVTRQVYEVRMLNALKQFECACDKMPASWSIVGDDVPLGFTPDEAYGLLLRYCHEDFWKP